MASVVETQRLISVSLGKIAQSRAQRGGINLHKNLLVASVLNKARTAFMMENYSHQLLQQKQQQIVLTAPQPQPAPVCNAPLASTTADPQRDGNSLPSHVVKTCQATQDVLVSAPADTQVSSGLENGSSPFQHITALIVNDKENISPSMDNTLSSSATDEINECKQQSVSGEQHIDAANQLSQDAQLAGSQSASFNNVYSSCSKQSQSTTGVLKRRRDNPEAFVSNESECSVSKKPRVSLSSDGSNSQSCDFSYSSSCEYESDCEQDMHATDSPQITNLVTILNSGFSGLCVSSSSPSYEHCHESDNSSMSHQWSNSRKLSDNQSLHCSSQVERIGSLSSAIVLSA